MAIRYIPEVHEFIKNHVKGTRTKELCNMVNREFETDFTPDKMKSYKKNHKLKSGLPTRSGKQEYTNTYPEEIVKFIHTNLSGNGPVKMAKLLNAEFGTYYTKNQLKGYYSRWKLDSGADGRFKEGHIPYNKGQKGLRIPGSEKGWFKKGQTSINHRNVGSERVNVDGYIEIKVAEPNIWRLKQVVEWEKRNGSIPEGHKIIFLDRNKLNTNIENLALVSNDVLLEMNRNNLFSEEAEMTETGVLIAKLSRRVHKFRKEEN